MNHLAEYSSLGLDNSEYFLTEYKEADDIVKGDKITIVNPEGEELTGTVIGVEDNGADFGEEGKLVIWLNTANKSTRIATAYPNELIEINS